MTQQARIWTERFRIRSYEVGPTGDVTMPSICNYLQEAAGNHAGRLGVSVDRFQEQNLTWVLTRLHVRMERYPAWRTEVRIETWPSGETGLLATREFLLYEADDDHPFGSATSAWVVLDTERRRPVRIPERVAALRLPDRPRPIPDAFPRLPAPDAAAFEQPFRIRYGDLDLNRHVNNVRYVEWAVETLPLEVIERRRLASLEVHFRAETTIGETVVGRASAGEDDTYRHRLLRAGDGREVALARTRWR